MSTNEFDRLIAENVSRQSYGYDTADWEKLTVQLGAARRKKRAMMFVYLSSGIAASIGIFLIGIVPLLSKKDKPLRQYQYSQRVSARATSGSADNNVGNTRPIDMWHSGHSKTFEGVSHEKEPNSTSDTIGNNDLLIGCNEEPENTSTPITNKQINISDVEHTSTMNGLENSMLPTFTDAVQKVDHKNINISVAGGVNYGTLNTGYTVGAAIDKKLNNRFGIEVMAAYVSNTTTAGSQGSNIYLPPTKPLSVVTSPLNYLQLTPMLNYSIAPKITLSAGADLQRLLEDHSVSIFYKDNVRIAPLMDLGALLRTEYSIGSRLKAGACYRFGINNILSPSNNYYERNYMQIQLKYKLH